VVDRAIVLYRPHWEWVAREVPPDLLDPYRLEAVLRTTRPGRHNVLILGDSVIDSALDTKRLNEALKDRGYRFTVLRIGGTPTVGVGFLANQLLELDPSAIVLAAGAYTIRSRDFYDGIYTYDVRLVPELFTLMEVLEHPGFHLAGLAGQANVLFRRRHSLQRVAAVRWGSSSWDRLRLEHAKKRLESSLGASPLLLWIRDRDPETYPNPNTRAMSLLARRTGSQGARFVVLESPTHEHVSLLLGKERSEAFLHHAGEMAKAHGFAVVKSTEVADLTLEDFKDHTHLNDHGRKVYTDGAIELFRQILS
jgi:hypothetical protein